MGEEFKDFLFRKLQEYEREQGQRVSLNEFADYIGVSRSLVSYWLSGRMKPSIPNVQLLAETLGNEAYTAMGLIPPDENLQYLERHWERLDPKIQEQIIQIVEKSIQTNLKAGNETTSPT